MNQRNNGKTLGYKIKETIYIFVLTLIILGGVIFAFVNTSFGHSLIVQDNAQRVSQTLTPAQAQKNKHVKTSYDARKTKSISRSELWRTRKLPAQPIGRLSIPSVNTHDPLFQGFGSQMQNLSYGVCTVLPNREMGGKNNYVLAGHYMNGFGPSVLDNLHEMKLHEKIYVTDMQKIYAYEAEAKAYDIRPDQVEVEDNHGKLQMITLITCSDFNIQKYGYGGHRTVVQGKLVDTYTATQSNLQKYELSNQVIKKQTHFKEKGIKQYTQNITLKQVEFWTAIVVVVILAIALFKTWFM